MATQLQIKTREAAEAAMAEWQAAGSEANEIYLCDSLRKWGRAHGHRVAKLSGVELVSLWNEHKDAEPAVVGTTGPEPDISAAQQAAPEPIPAPAGTDAAAALQTLMSALQTPQGISEARVIELIGQHAQTPVTEIVVKAVSGNSVKVGTQHKTFKQVLKLAEQRENCYLVGPAGSGKTTVAAKVAEALELPFYEHGAMSAKHDFFGYMDANGIYHRTAFREAFEHGGVFLWDEMDSSIPHEAITANGAIAASVGQEISFPDGMVARHADFIVIAAANTYGSGASREYVGRYQLDAATLDRFAVLDFPYDTKLERALAGNDDWTFKVQQIRKAVEKLKIRHIVSPRASIKGAKMLAAGMDEKQVAELYLWRGISKDDRQRIETEASI
jgi:MoxR-like ATPase